MPPKPGSRGPSQGVLTDRITTLEKQIGSCEERASRAEELRDKTLQKCRELGSELTQTKASLRSSCGTKMSSWKSLPYKWRPSRIRKT